MKKFLMKALGVLLLAVGVGCSSITPKLRCPEESVVNIAIAQDGKVKIDGMAVELKDLESRLLRVSELAPNQTVNIRAGRKTKLGDIVQVLDVCHKARVYNYSLLLDNVEDVKKEVTP